MTTLVSPKKNIVWDATTLTTFMSCPWLLDLRFNRNFYPLGGKANSLECGSLAHKILEVFYREKIKDFTRKQAIASGMTAGLTYIQGCRECTDFIPGDPCPACKDSLEDKECFVCHDKHVKVVPECGHQINEYPGMMNTPAENETNPKRIGYKWVLETMEQYFDFWKNEFWVPLEVENVRKKVLYEDDTIRILWKAKLDVLLDTLKGIVPCDHKTMSQNRPNLSLNNQFMGQCLVTDSQSIIIDKIGFQTSLEPEEKFLRPMISYSTARLLEWQSHTLPSYAYEMLTCYETGYWPMRLTYCENKYGNCNFTKICEADPEMREEKLRQDFMVGEAWDP